MVKKKPKKPNLTTTRPATGPSPDRPSGRPNHIVSPRRVRVGSSAAAMDSVTVLSTIHSAMLTVPSQAIRQRRCDMSITTVCLFQLLSAPSSPPPPLHCTAITIAITTTGTVATVIAIVTTVAVVV